MILTDFGLVASFTDPQLYFMHEPPHTKQTTSDEHPALPPSLKMVLSTHVDDLKGSAPKKTALALLEHLQKHVGECKQEWDNFTHTGIEHETRPDRTVYTHQAAYISQLHLMDPKQWLTLSPEDEVDSETHAIYMSLLGGIAWVVLTVPAIAVYVQAAQRRAHRPRAVDCVRLNAILKWLRKHPSGILHPKLKGPLRLTGVSDAAFRQQPDESTGLCLRGCVVMLTTADPRSPTSPSGECSILEYCSKRQRRVVRSTFSAELNALVDCVELLLVIQACLHQLLQPPGAGRH